MFLTEVGIPQIPQENSPESFMFLDKNVQWPNESISCVIQKPVVAFFNIPPGILARI